MNLNYRKDIDGLRAISVLAVLLNHAGIGLFSGGFIGVDIFFVISGYLITTIIIREIQTNEFSLIRFYERRIRRILPALFAVTVFTIAICAILYDPEKFKDFGKSVIATILFASNFNFWKESGYFDAPSQLKPLLHTWSLAVEEQFYIFFPLFMAGIYRFARKQVPLILAGVMLLSFSLSLYGVSKDPSAAFYLAHMRTWELMIGSILALNLIPVEFREKYGNLIGVAGLVMIAIPIFQYSESTKFPGATALAPVLGAACILISGMEESKSLTKKLLSLSPLVFVGKISYSLYLWHWPLIIFFKYYTIRQMTSSELGSLLIAILIISTLSWRFIETPFRSKNFMSTHQIYAFAASGMAVMLLAGYAVYHFKGFPERQGFEYLAENKVGEEWTFRECNVNYTDNLDTIHPCKIGDRSQPPSFIVWGDSHAPTFGKGLHTSATQHGVSGLITYGNGCPSLLGIAIDPWFGDVECNKYNNMVLDYLKDHPEIDTVILASRWTILVEGNRYKQEEGDSVHLTDTLDQTATNLDAEELVKIGLERTIETILATNRRVVIIGPLPEIGYDVPSANFIASRTGRDTNEMIAPSLEEYLTRNQKMFAILKEFEEKYGIQIVEPWKSLCQGDICRAVIDEIPLYRDDDHLSVFGSELLAPIFDPIFEFKK